MNDKNDNQKTYIFKCKTITPQQTAIELRRRYFV